MPTVSCNVPLSRTHFSALKRMSVRERAFPCMEMRSLQENLFFSLQEGLRITNGGLLLDEVKGEKEFQFANSSEPCLESRKRSVEAGKNREATLSYVSGGDYPLTSDSLD